VKTIQNMINIQHFSVKSTSMELIIDA
jgi:hypothetical protein